METAESLAAEPSFAEYQRQALENLQIMSRTSRGVSDTSMSINKPKLNTEGQDLADKTAANFQKALGIAWDHRLANLDDPAIAETLVMQIANQVSEGLLQPGQSIFRIWETKYPTTPPAAIPAKLAEFYSEFGPVIDTCTPIDAAGWVEQMVDGKIHPFADGCGRTAKVISGLVLMRHQQSLPVYRGRKEYYAHIQAPLPKWLEHYRSYFA